MRDPLPPKERRSPSGTHAPDARPRARDAPRELPDDDVADPFEELIVELLAADDAERARRIARIELEDARVARRVRSRLALLGDLGMAVDQPARATPIPERFGALRRLERIGAGGMGEVHLARDEITGELAAIKLVRPDHLWFEGARGRFRREVEATTHLVHPGIVRVRSVGEDAGVPWLAMEWVGGTTLEDVLDRLRGAPPESLQPRDFVEAVKACSSRRPHAEEAREDAFPGKTYVEVVTRIVIRVAEALAHAHETGVLHRDVKPSNVMVTPSGRVLLADFGLALPRGADRMTRTGSWLGSLPYAAPEQIEGSPRALDRRADVYSLGATLYELLTLRTPFLGGPESSVRRRIATSDLERPRRLNPAVSPEIERVCLAALDPDPSRRPLGGTELAIDLDSALVGRRVRARSAPAWLRARRWARRRPSSAAALVGLALVVASSVVVALRESALAARLTRLADAELVHALQAEASEFWPAERSESAAMTAWLARADELLARRAEHRRAYDELSQKALPYATADRLRDHSATLQELAGLAHELDGLAAFVGRGDRAAAPLPPSPDDVRRRDEDTLASLDEKPGSLVDSLRGRVISMRITMQQDAKRWSRDITQLDDFAYILDRAEKALRERSTFRFTDPLDAWRHEALRVLLADLDALDELAPRVRAQRTATEELAKLEEGDGATLWRSTIDAIARSPKYGGLAIEPVFGLVPLGENAATGLQEFLVAQSGDAPVRDPASPGASRIDARTGIVLVLLRGGRFRMGQRDDEGPISPSARPVHEVELAPFLVSKYELTCAQAERMGGFPSEKVFPADGRLPLAIDWDRGRALVRRFGLELPTEAQWEYAARGDVEGVVTLEGRANVYDQARAESIRVEGSQVDPAAATFDDGFVMQAPIGSFLPNPFGLYDVLGNVAEWCLDCHVSRGYTTLVPRAGDGLRATVTPAQLRALRGGSCADTPRWCAVPNRTSETPSKLVYWIGVRPVRGLASD